MPSLHQMCRKPCLLAELANYVDAIVIAGQQTGGDRGTADTATKGKSLALKRERSKQKIEHCYLNGRTALHAAARTQNAEAIGLLLTAARTLYDSRSPEFREFVNRVDKYACTALHYSVLLPFRGWDRAESRACVELLLRAGADPVARQPDALVARCDSQCGWGHTPLYKLIERASQNVWSPKRGSSLVNIRERMSDVADRAARLIVVKTIEAGHVVKLSAFRRLCEMDWPQTTLYLWNSLPTEDTRLHHRILNCLIRYGSHRSLLCIIRHASDSFGRCCTTRWFRTFNESRPSHFASKLALSIVMSLPILRPWATETHSSYPSEFKKSFVALAGVLERGMRGHTTGIFMRIIGGYMRADYFVRGTGFPYRTIRRTALACYYSDR